MNEPKFQRATKTDVHYTGQINGKTWVVPHSFHGSHDVSHGTKVTPIRHNIVVSPNHVAHNNPSLTPEEHARVHQHIKDIHGGQEGNAPKFDSFGKLGESWLPMRGPRASKETPEVNAEHEKWEQGHATRKELKAARPMRTGAAERFMRRYGKTNEERQLALHLGMKKSDKPAVASATDDSYEARLASRKAATLAFARKRGIIKEKGDAMPLLPLNELSKKVMGDVFTHHQTQIAKKTLRMPDAMVGVMGGPNKEESRAHLKKIGWTEKQIHNHEHAQFAESTSGFKLHPWSKAVYLTSKGKKVPFGRKGDFTEKDAPAHLKPKMVQEHVWNVTDHMGHKHEVEAKDHAEAMKKTVSVGGIHPAGIPMTQWRKVRIEKKNLEEAEQLDEDFMSTYRRNENANRHTANIVHLAKHFGDADDQAQAKFYAAELKKHGHQPHHEAAYKLHQKLYPKAVKSHMETHPQGHVRLHKEETLMEDHEKAFNKVLVKHGYSEHLQEHSETFNTVKRVLEEARFTGRLRTVNYTTGRLRKADPAADAQVARWLGDAQKNRREAAQREEAKKKVKEETEQLNELSDAAKKFVHHREEHWKHEKLNRHAQDRTAARFHSNEMQKHFHAMTPDEKYRAHTGSYVSSPSRRLGGGSAKEDKEYVRENIMNTDRRFTGGYEIPHNDHTEYKAWGQVTHHSDAEAKQDRDKKAKEWKAKGFKVTKHRTTGQIFDPDGPFTSSGTVYTARKHH